MKIISASRRQDMVAFNKDYLKKKFREMGPDHFWVFWTKNPANLLEMDLDFSRCALQLTVTGLGGTALEPGVPGYASVLKSVEQLVGEGFDPRLINWRYDPIIPGHSSPRTAACLASFFSAMNVTRCMASFVTWYGHVKEHWPEGFSTQVSTQREREIVRRLKDIFSDYGITLYGCAQPHLAGVVKPARCVDGEYYSTVTGFNFNPEKDANQRKTCGCTMSIDIGRYNPCPHKCVYCYAVPGDVSITPGASAQGSLFDQGQLYV